MCKEKVYAIYKGDEFVDMGTSKELAKKFGIREESVKFFSYPTNHRRNKGKRKIAIVIDDEEGEK